MMTGLGVLKVYGYLLNRRLRRTDSSPETKAGDGINELDDVATASALPLATAASREGDKGFDVFRQLERAEWDTLMFFYGIILTVGGLCALGYLALASGAVYGGLGPTWANVLVGAASALVDNIPIRFAPCSTRIPRCRRASGCWSRSPRVSADPSFQ